MTPAQHGFEQDAVAHHLLQIADAPVVFGIVRVQHLHPEVFAHRTQLGLAVTQLQAQAVVAEQHLPVLHVMYIEQIRNRAHHFGPETLTLDQRQLDTFAAGDIADAQGDGLIILNHFRQTQYQPYMALQALCGDQLGFQLHQIGAFEHGHGQAITQIVGLYRAVVDQLLPGLLGALHPEQVERHLIGFGEVQVLDQLLLVCAIGTQPALQAGFVTQLVLQQQAAHAGEIEDAQGHAGTLEDILIAPAGFLQHAHGLLLVGHVTQHPDVAGLVSVIADIAARHGKQPFATFTGYPDQLCAEVAALLWAVEQQGIQIRQQFQQMQLASAFAAETEQGLGLRIQVAHLAIGLGNQNPFLDGAKRAGSLAQRAA